MLGSFKVLVLGVAVVAATALMVGNVLAAKPEDNSRPGWGFGDENHDHTGPPGGPSVHPVHSE